MRKRLTAIALAATVLASHPTQAHAPGADQQTAHVWEKLLHPEPNPVQLRCLARNIYWEGRGEPEEGQIAVAFVTINRTRDRDFPNTICGVVQQGASRKSCQFSWVCDGRGNQPVNDEAYQTAERIARDALRGRLKDPTHGALYFHNRHLKPQWAAAKSVSRRIGEHVFFRLASSDDGK